LKFGTTRTGRLVIAKGNSEKTVFSESEGSLLQALSDWETALPKLEDEYKALPATQVALSDFAAPLPKTWAFLDGSAFIQHIVLVRQARKAALPEDLTTIPLMYQGISDTLEGPTAGIPAFGPSDGLDFEGEIGIITDEVPMGTTAEEAEKHIKLVVLLNDVSLRNLIPREVGTGFGFIQSKPGSAFAPWAVTPDELGDAWRDSRLNLPLVTDLNGEQFGNPDAGEMHFSFAELIAHAAKTRRLSAGTIIGSGTVANKNPEVGSSCIAERRMLEIIETGEATTPFLKPGDRVQMEVRKDGHSLFGQIDQTVA